MDEIDNRLLNLLQDDCTQSLEELGKAVGLSITAVNERLKKLRARGNIRAYVALIDPQRLGYNMCAFVLVIVEGKKQEQEFLKSILRITEVQECHRVSGEFPYLLKIWVRDLKHLEDMIEKIKALAGVLRIQILVVLSSLKDKVTGLPPTQGV